MKNVIALIFFFFILGIYADDMKNYPDRNSIDAAHEDSLKLILENIAKIKVQNEGLFNPNKSSGFSQEFNNVPFPSDDLCVIQSQEKCLLTCSNVDLCVQCLKSISDGFGFKCLVKKP